MPGHESMTDVIAALSSRNAYLEARHHDERAKLIESTASMVLPALILQGGNQTRAQMARSAIERAVSLADEVDAYFAREMGERPR